MGKGIVQVLLFSSITFVNVSMAKPSGFFEKALLVAQSFRWLTSTELWYDKMIFFFLIN